MRISRGILHDLKAWSDSEVTDSIHARHNTKAWFQHMRLTYSHVYSHENQFNLIGGNALNNLKKNNLIIFREIIRLFL